MFQCICRLGVAANIKPHATHNAAQLTHNSWMTQLTHNSRISSHTIRGCRLGVAANIKPHAIRVDDVSEDVSPPPG